MNEIKKITEVKSGSITIDLPDEFNEKKVEIIISPIEDNEENHQSLQKLLLNGPTLTDDELQEYQRVRDWMNQWSIREF